MFLRDFVAFLFLDTFEYETGETRKSLENNDNLNQSKLCHMVAKFASNASCAIWWTNVQIMQVAPSGGQIGTNASGAVLLPNSVQVTESISGSVVPGAQQQ